ncbi:MAG: adenine-specific methyltransferase EcoRI family protein, partial [Patescibacteria group bacterium]|nr:adenine-specific methyltransferase EcoRI family protein [Patescibacteria group bacterium]
MANTNLRNANKAKKDEFYTQLEDIEKELKHYKEQYKNKVVYCNWDDPVESNFFKYFASNFKALGLKKLISTSYSG